MGFNTEKSDSQHTVLKRGPPKVLGIPRGGKYSQ